VNRLQGYQKSWLYGRLRVVASVGVITGAVLRQRARRFGGAQSSARGTIRSSASGDGLGIMQYDVDHLTKRTLSVLYCKTDRRLSQRQSIKMPMNTEWRGNELMRAKNCRRLQPYVIGFCTACQVSALRSPIPL